MADDVVTGVSRWPWVAGAAVLIFALMLFVPFGNEKNPSMPEPAGEPGVGSLVKGPLPRDACRLQWTPGPKGSTYRLTVLTEELRTLATWEGLEEPGHLIPSGVLKPIEGDTFVWRVEVSPPGSDAAWSGTFTGELEN